MSTDRMQYLRKRIDRPTLLLHGGGGANTPGDRETRYTPYDAERENKS